MEIKTVTECLNFVDDMILCSIQKHAVIGNLENLRNYMIGMCNEKYIEEMVSMLAILSQITLIKEKFYLDNESDFKKQYGNLGKTYISLVRRK